MFAGIFSAIYSFVARHPQTALIISCAAILLGGISIFKARKNIDDTQVATAGVFMAAVACAVSLWQMYQ